MQRPSSYRQSRASLARAVYRLSNWLLAGLFFIISTLPFASALAADAPKTVVWEAPMAPGKELDPVALNLALGRTEVPNQGVLETMRSYYEAKKYSFHKIKPKAPHDAIYQVALKEDSTQRVPPDMAGIGPFFLIKSGDRYYALTTNNFARLFAPLDKAAQVMPYLEYYEALYVDPFCKLVQADMEKEFTKAGRTPPSVSTVIELADGYNVRLIIYVGVHIEAFFEKTVHVARDGTVKLLEPPKMLQKLGEGKFF